MNNPGGAERVLADVVSGLANRGHDVSVLSYDKPGSDSYYRLDERVKRIELGLGSTQKKARVFETLSRMYYLRRTVRDAAPEVVIGFMHSMYIPLGIAMIGLSIPLVASEHTVPEYYESRPLESGLLRLTPFLASRVTVVSVQAMQSYASFLRRVMVVVPNPVSIEVKHSADVRDRPDKRNILLTVGRLEGKKGHKTLISAYAKLADRFDNWDLRIVGEGSLRPELEAEIKRYSLNDRVVLAGATKDIGKEYESAQLFVVPSTYESFGLAAAEALVHALPVVGFSDCPGVNELIKDNENGLLATPLADRASALADTLERLMTNEALRVKMAQASRDSAPSYGLDAVLDRWESVLNTSNINQPQ